MGKNTPENIGARVKSDEDQYRAEGRFFTGPGPRAMEAFPRGFSAGSGADRHAAARERALEAKGPALCAGQKPLKKSNGVDFGDAIGKELQNLYDDVVAQPVPDRFLSLLNQLEKNVVSSALSKSAPGERE